MNGQARSLSAIDFIQKSLPALCHLIDLGERFGLSSEETKQSANKRHRVKVKTNQMRGSSNLPRPCENMIKPNKVPKDEATLGIVKLDTTQIANPRI